MLGIDGFVAELEELKRRDHPFTISGAGDVVHVSYGTNAASFTIFESGWYVAFPGGRVYEHLSEGNELVSFCRYAIYNDPPFDEAGLAKPNVFSLREVVDPARLALLRLLFASDR
jgi:hypothetical protein